MENNNYNYKERLICIKDSEDQLLKSLQSQGYQINQISASGIYCWVLLIKYESNKIPNQVITTPVTMTTLINPLPKKS